MSNPDFDKIWGVNSSLDPYNISDTNYKKGWEFVGSMPPARVMFDYIHRFADQKMKNLNERTEALEVVNGVLIPKRKTAYSVGATGIFPGIPASWYVECTTAGTTGTTAPVITPPVTAGDTITDGSVVWTVRRAVCEADYPKTSFGTAVVNHLLGSTLASLVSAVSTDSLFSKLLKKALEAAGLQYSMGTNGYICLGSLFGGLILQWGVVNSTESQFITVTYPVSFRGTHRFMVSSQNKNSGIVAGFQNGVTSGTIQIEQPYNGLSINWFAIGY